MPPGNQSPFPLQEPPHQPSPEGGAAEPPAHEPKPAPADSKSESRAESKAGGHESVIRGLLPMLAGAAGLGVVVAAATALFSGPAGDGSGKAKRKRSGGKKGKSGKNGGAT